MSTANSFIGVYGTLLFSNPPLRGNAERCKKHQTTGFDSNGDQYVYAKSQTVSRYTKLSLKVNPLQLTQLIMFHLSQGPNWFTWYDHTNTGHDVIFTSGIAYRQVNTKTFSVEILLEGKS